MENVENMSDPVEKAIKKFEFYPSILLIKNRMEKSVSQNLFCFNEVTKAELICSMSAELVHWGYLAV